MILGPDFCPYFVEMKFRSGPCTNSIPYLSVSWKGTVAHGRKVNKARKKNWEVHGTCAPGLKITQAVHFFGDVNVQQTMF